MVTMVNQKKQQLETALLTRGDVYCVADFVHRAVAWWMDARQQLLITPTPAPAPTATPRRPPTRIQPPRRAKRPRIEPPEQECTPRKRRKTKQQQQQYVYEPDPAIDTPEAWQDRVRSVVYETAEASLPVCDSPFYCQTAVTKTAATTATIPLKTKTKTKAKTTWSCSGTACQHGQQVETSSSSYFQPAPTAEMAPWSPLSTDQETQLLKELKKSNKPNRKAPRRVDLSRRAVTVQGLRFVVDMCRGTPRVVMC